MNIHRPSAHVVFPIASADTRASASAMPPASQPGSTDPYFSEWSKAWQAANTRNSAFEWVKTDVDKRVEERAVALRASIAELDEKIKDYPDDAERIKGWKEERNELHKTIARFEREEVNHLPDDQRQAYDFMIRRNAINKLIMDDLINKVFFENNNELEEDPF